MPAKRIVIYRQGAIGDIVHTLVLVKYIRKQEPDAQIEFCCGPVTAELLQNCCDYIDKVWIINKASFEADFAKVGRSDEFIFLHTQWYKAWWINFRHIKASKLFCYKYNSKLSAVANYVTARFPQIETELIKNPYAVLDHRTLVNQDLLQGVQEQGLRNYICIVLGVGNLRPHRAYPLTKWLEFIKTQIKDTNYQIKILGGPDEKDLSLEFEAHLKQDTELQSSRIENLIGKTSLVELVVILSQAQELYSADTGILHIGAASGAAITSIFSITNPNRFGPFSPDAKVLASPRCQCQLDSGRKKHCTKLKDGFAGCIWNISL
ncbi:MAG: glycosyltransferase family 9 protein [Candidatus Melainabacteria bacterium]|nr:glycosyltransferase family 9 protein [Candidatus Melainabacteria bacterium]